MTRGREPQVRLLLRDEPSAMDRRFPPPWADAPLSERLALAMNDYLHAALKRALRKYGIRWVGPLEWVSPPADAVEAPDDASR